MMQILLLSSTVHDVTMHLLAFKTVPQVSGANCLDPANPNVANGTPGASLSHLIGNVANALTGGIADRIKKALDLAWQTLQFFWLLVTNRAKFFRDVMQWGIETFFPTSLQTWFGGTISGSATLTGCNNSVTPVYNIYGDLYDSTTGAAAVIAATAAACRVLRAMLDARISGMVMVVDTMPRFFVALIGSQALGKDILVAAVNGTMKFANAVTGAIISTKGAAGWGQDLISVMIALVFGANVFVILLGLVLIPLILLLLYAVCLMVIRTVMLGFVFATAPLCIATVAFDHKNRFFVWWTKLLVGVLCLPLVLGMSIAISIALARDLLVVPFIGPFMAGITMCCGVWMGGKIVHKLTWDDFSHGGPLGALMIAAAAGGKVAQMAVSAGANPGGIVGHMINFGANTANMPPTMGAPGARYRATIGPDVAGDV